MPTQPTIAAVLFPGFELLDVFGPLEAFGMLAEAGQCKILTVAETAGAIASRQGPRTIADFSFDDCPALDLFLVPGGQGTRKEITNDRMLGWLRERAQSTALVTSVCTGAALLARAGLLDGRRATTNKFAFKWVVEQGPRVEWVKEARWVEDGKFLTSSGVSAGIDMALAIIAKLWDLATAERIATRMEYEWHRDAGWDPFAKVHGLV
ncbi:MAG: DJ-1/PfpI family protein [Candidatus Binataceae bacterium]